MKVWMGWLAGIWICALGFSMHILNTTAQTKKIRQKQAASIESTGPTRAARAAELLIRSSGSKARPAAPLASSESAAMINPNLPALNIRLLGTSVQAADATAVIEDGFTQKSGIYSVGDSIQGWRLAQIAQASVTLESNGARKEVFLDNNASNGESLAQVDMSADPQLMPKDLDAWRRVAEKLFNGSEHLDEEQVNRIKSASTVISDTERSVKRDEVAAATKGDIFKVAQGVVFMPAFNGIKLVGIKIQAISDDGILRQSGLQPGDVIQTVNGQSVVDPAAVMNMGGQLFTAGVIQVKIERNGQPVILTYRMQ